MRERFYRTLRVRRTRRKLRGCSPHLRNLEQSSGVAMHFLVGLGILAGFIGFAFGENAARAFVGIILAGAVALAIGFAWLAIGDLIQ